MWSARGLKETLSCLWGCLFGDNRTLQIPGAKGRPLDFLGKERTSEESLPHTIVCQKHLGKNQTGTHDKSSWRAFRR